MKYTQILQISENEYWYGLAGGYGTRFPLSKKDEFSYDMTTAFTGNQESPFLVSSNGRYIWCEDALKLTVANGTLTVESDYEITYREGFGDLRAAYLAACNAHFKPSGVLPAENFFRKPQYNTWVELIYDQNQADVLRYAHGIIDNGLPAGILMIDDNWNCYYGKWEFNRATFPDPRAMVDELHALGFEVMLWICPFISPDSAEYRTLSAKGYLVCDSTGAVALRHWWNGVSAVLDFSNPGAVAWFYEQTERLHRDYGVDGFKFDAGDCYYYKDDDKTFAPITSHGQCEAWAKFGLRYPYNEYRACFKCAGEALVQRLCDKSHKWEGGVDTLIPNTLAQGILGYSYTCPDMIGGGSFTDFLPGAPTLDRELFVRSAQSAALLPMMQYSAAPWRVLTRDYADICIAAGKLHLDFADSIFALVQNAAKTGEPVIRYMEYVFPHVGYAHINDQFMLGDTILCAPVVKKGAVTRDVVLPAGSWRYCDGTVYAGGQTVTVDAPITVLPYFVLV